MSTEPGKHAHRSTLPPVATPPRVSNLPGVPVLGAIVAALITVSVVLWLIWAPWSDDDEKKTTTAPTSSPLGSGYGAEWTDADGHRYRITVKPATSSSDKAGPGGCVPAPTDDKVNVRFALGIDNLGTKEAPIPDVELGANLGPLGTVKPALLSLDRSSRTVALTTDSDAPCGPKGELNADSHAPLVAAASAEFTGVIGGVDPGKDGRATGLILIVRYHSADGAAPGGSSAQEFVVPFTLSAAE